MENLEIINKEEGLLFVDNDLELYKILIESFLYDNSFQLDTMESLVEQANPEDFKSMETAAKYVHYMKGAAKQLCAKALSTEAEKLEQILRGKETGDVLAIKDKVKELYIETVKQLENILKEN